MESVCKIVLATAISPGILAAGVHALPGQGDLISGEATGCLLLPEDFPQKKSPSISVLEDKIPGSLHLWHLYERTDATAAVGDEISFVGRVLGGEKQVFLADPPWITVAFSRKQQPGTNAETFQAFSFQCEKLPKNIDATGLARFAGKVFVNRPELSTQEKDQKNIPVFRIEPSRITPIPCLRSLGELKKSAAKDIRAIEPDLRELCGRYGLKYDFDESKLAHSWYKGYIAFTTIVTRHPRFSFRPVPYGTISVLYRPETGRPSGFIFTRRIWQDPRD